MNTQLKKTAFLCIIIPGLTSVIDYVMCLILASLFFYFNHGLVISPLFTCLAAQINTKLCDKFSVGHYPMLFWGPPPKFVSGSWEPKQEKSEIRIIDDGRTADRLLNWINKQTGRYELITSIYC